MSAHATWRLFVVALAMSHLHLSWQVVVQPPADFFANIDGSSIATGMSHHCAIALAHGDDYGGTAYCWGDNEMGATEAPKEEKFVQLVAGMFFTCGINIEQRVICWGFIRGPSEVDSLFVQITAGSDFACGVMTSKKVVCWGDTRELIRPLVTASEDARNVATNKPLSDEYNYVQISCSKFHCCALDDYGLVHCFGRGAEELIPPTTSTGASSARLVKNTDYEEDKYSKADSLKAEYDNTEEGEEETVVEEEEQIIKEKKQFKQLSVGDGNSCGILLESDDIECWGRARWHYKLPRHVPGPFRQVSVGPSGMCAIYGASDDDDDDDDDKEDEATVKNEKVVAKKPEVVKASSEDYDNGDEEDDNIGGSSEQEAETVQEPAAATINKEDRVVCFGMIEVHSSQAAEQLWDQVLVGPGSVCGVTVDGRLKCYGLHSKENFPHDTNIALA